MFGGMGGMPGGMDSFSGANFGAPLGQPCLAALRPGTCCDICQSMDCTLPSHRPTATARWCGPWGKHLAEDRGPSQFDQTAVLNFYLVPCVLLPHCNITRHVVHDANMWR